MARDADPPVAETGRGRYVIQTNAQFAGLQKMDLAALAEACPHDWFNQTLCLVNESVVRLGVFKGEFHWHKHDREDEYFYVISGLLLVDLEGETVALGNGQGMLVPRRVLHRTRAPERTAVLMVESASVTPTGDR